MARHFTDPHDLDAVLHMPDAPAILDLRTPEDAAADPTRLPAARRLSLAELERGAGPDGPVVVYCQKGGKISQLGAAMLRARGGTATALSGGHLAWCAAGRPVQALEGPGAAWVMPLAPDWPTLCALWVLRRLVDPDVRVLPVAADQCEAGAAVWGAERLPADLAGDGCAGRPDPSRARAPGRDRWRDDPARAARADRRCGPGARSRRRHAGRRRMTPGWGRMLRVFGRIGIVSFGGPAAQIAVMHRELVERERWLDEETFLRGLGFCTLLPGPEAMQLATFAGWRLRGTAGGLLAGALFVLPGAAVMIALASAYLAFGRLPAVEAAFLGIKAAALAIVAGALWKLRAKALRGPLALGVAVAAFAALFLLDAPFWSVLGAALLLGAARPEGVATVVDPFPWRRTVGTVTLWLAIWWLPLLSLLWLAPGSVPAQAGLFFSWLATVSFGGAYAVLAALAQTAVEGQGWLTAEQMIDGLGLAETTPGPLILVTLFTGWLAGAQAGGTGLAWLTGLVSLHATFAPCFLWIFAGAPHLERLTANPRLRGALAMVSAAVAGVIANLSVWFAVHVLFREVAEGRGPPRPDPASLDPAALALAIFAGLWLLVLRRGLFETLGLAAAGGLGLHLLG
ncbi:chromate efflux transporter [Jannaschia ovalis]|uniref:Chromate efflux transporter n=1 Tax=Jannaschia ovalis TaxID=3038773 RepID=A0ABY8LCN7_9RHOB|nr:chromate efflux transporter [Jannaschia sp. GRR-S6-38]WGH79088.1 chromate efflux transporter [Jannaschia sp. GRR-S6-38]